MRHPTVTAALALVAAHTAFAADGDKSIKDQLAALSTDLSAPSHPATSFVGLSSEGILAPKTRKAFETALTGIGKEGGKAGYAIEVLPYWLVNEGKLEYWKYRTDPGLRAMTMTSVGVASGTRTVEGHEVSARGVALSSVLVDLADPAFSYQLKVCLDKVQQDMLTRLGNAPDSGEVIDVKPGTKTRIVIADSEIVRDEQAAKDYQACLTQRAPSLWNRTRLSVGLATGNGRETAGAMRSVDYGRGTWLTFQYGFEGWDTLARWFSSSKSYVDCDELAADGTCTKPHEPSSWEQNAMLTFHARRTSGASDLDFSRSGDFRKLDSTLLGARLTYGSERRSVFAEVSRNATKGDGVDKRTDQHVLGFSYRIDKGMWLTAARGRRAQYVDGKLDNTFELNLSWAMTKEPVFTKP